VRPDVAFEAVFAQFIFEGLVADYVGVHGLGRGLGDTGVPGLDGAEVDTG